MNRKTMKPIRSLGLVFIAFLLIHAGCSSPSLYDQWYPIDAKGWHEGSGISFTVPVTDTVNYYDLSIGVRNSSAYSYNFV